MLIPEFDFDSADFEFVQCSRETVDGQLLHYQLLICDRIVSPVPSELQPTSAGFTSSSGLLQPLHFKASLLSY